MTTLQRALMSSKDTLNCFSWLARRLNPFTWTKLVLAPSPPLLKYSSRTCNKNGHFTRLYVQVVRQNFSLTLTTAVLTTMFWLCAMAIRLSCCSTCPTTLRTWEGERERERERESGKMDMSLLLHRLPLHLAHTCVSGRRVMIFLTSPSRPTSRLVGISSFMSPSFITTWPVGGGGREGGREGRVYM